MVLIDFLRMSWFWNNSCARMERFCRRTSRGYAMNNKRMWNVAFNKLIGRAYSHRTNRKDTRLRSKKSDTNNTNDIGIRRKRCSKGSTIWGLVVGSIFVVTKLFLYFTSYKLGNKTCHVQHSFRCINWERRLFRIWKKKGDLEHETIYIVDAVFS